MAKRVETVGNPRRNWTKEQWAAWEAEQELKDAGADDLPSDEDMFLEELGVGGDGSAMTPSDDAWDGRPWDPDRAAGNR